MSRIAGRFAQLKEAGRTALVPYLTAGDPEPAATVPLLHTLVQAGADLIELGVPFSDPMADGPVIQAACERALAHRVRLRDVLDMAAEFRNDDAETPLILMGYTNPIVAMGVGAFAEQAAQAGVDGVLVVDLPPEEADAIRQAMIDHELDEIFLLAPTTTETRIRQICGQAKGFLYYVSLRGTTGADRLDMEDVAERMKCIRTHATLPVGIGFGIKDADSAARAAELADAVVVGSALVDRIQAAADPHAAATELLQDLRAGIDTADRPGGTP